MNISEPLAFIEAEIEDSADALTLRLIAARLGYLKEKALYKADQCPQSVEDYVMKNATEKVQ